MMGLTIKLGIYCVHSSYCDVFKWDVLYVFQPITEIRWYGHILYVILLWCWCWVREQSNICSLLKVRLNAYILPSRFLDHFSDKQLNGIEWKFDSRCTICESLTLRSFCLNYTKKIPDYSLLRSVIKKSQIFIKFRLAVYQNFVNQKNSPKILRWQCRC